MVFDSKLRDVKTSLEVAPIPETLEESQMPEEEHREELLTYVEPFFDIIAIVEDGEPCTFSIRTNDDTQQDEGEDIDIVPSSQGEDTPMDEAEGLNAAIWRRMSFFRVGDHEDAIEDEEQDGDEGGDKYGSEDQAVDDGDGENADGGEDASGEDAKGGGSGDGGNGEHADSDENAETLEYSEYGEDGCSDEEEDGVEAESVVPFEVVRWREERVQDPQHNDKERTLFHIIL